MTRVYPRIKYRQSARRCVSGLQVRLEILSSRGRLAVLTPVAAKALPDAWLSCSARVSSKAHPVHSVSVLVNRIKNLLSAPRASKCFCYPWITPALPGADQRRSPGRTVSVPSGFPTMPRKPQLTMVRVAICRQSNLTTAV